MWLFEEDRTQTRPENFKLHTLCEYFGVSRPDHTALRDIRATVELYRAMEEHTMHLTIPQQQFLAELSRQTKRPWFHLLNQAINHLVDDLKICA